MATSNGMGSVRPTGANGWGLVSSSLDIPAGEENTVNGILGPKQSLLQEATQRLMEANETNKKPACMKVERQELLCPSGIRTPLRSSEDPGTIQRKTEPEERRVPASPPAKGAP